MGHRSRQVLRTRPPELPGARVRGGRPLHTHPAPPPHTRVWQRPRFLWKRIRPHWGSAAGRSRSERRRGLSGPRSPRLPAPPPSPLPPPPCSPCLPPLPPLPRLHQPCGDSAGGRRCLTCLPGTCTLVTRRVAPRDQWEPFSPRCRGEPHPRPPRERRGKPAFAHAQEENRGWGHANIHPCLPVYPLSAVRTGFYLSSCDEPEATGFAWKKQTTQQHKQANKIKKYESNAAPAAAVVRGRGRALSVFPAEQAAGPPAARTAAAALLPPARNSPRFGS
ncbi:D(4) dopamine receptor-like [Neopelma chrysocephalum]|uniref:D(4) dopamine receptor-like n=1 Tax=Neopelma chrysocephalum TaxID=114329 RepID=UPI000FCD4C64|nr:D(4) dopamine receptor-like [Neopelma chrysocephalum]